MNVVTNVVTTALLALAVPGVFGQAETKTVSQATEPAPTSLGTVTVDGKSVSLSYVYAIRGPAFMDEKKEEVRIILSDVPATADELISDSAIMHRGRAGKVSGVVVRLDMEANAGTGELYHSALGNLHMALHGEHEFKPTAFDDQRVSGTLFMPEPRESWGYTYHYTATFDVAIQRQSDLKAQVSAAAAAEAAKRVPPTAEEAAAAAASGPGQVASEYLKALLAQDLAAMKKLAVNPQMFADLEGGFGAMAMGLMAEAFRGARVTRVNQTGDTAIVEVEVPVAPAPAKIPTVLVKGVWKLADEDGKNAPEAAAPTPAAEGIGTLTVGENTVPLRHAYAFREPSRAISGKEDVRIVLSDVPITFVEQEDGFFVPEEAGSSSDETEAGGRNRVEVTFDAEYKTQRFGEIYPDGSEADGIMITSEFERTAFDDQRVAGRLFVFGKGETINGVRVHYTASFDAAIQRNSRPRPTTASGADAAETGPGEVAWAIIKAVQARDLEAVKPHLAAADRRRLDFLQLELGDFFQHLFHLREQVTILSVTETGDEAVVVCEELDPDNTKFETTLSMVREEGVWKLTQ